MCIEIHMPDGRIIDAITRHSRPLFSEDPPDKDAICLCRLSTREIFLLVVKNLAIPEISEIDRLSIERGCMEWQVKLLSEVRGG